MGGSLNLPVGQFNLCLFFCGPCVGHWMHSLGIIKHPRTLIGAVQSCLHESDIVIIVTLVTTLESHDRIVSTESNDLINRLKPKDDLSDTIMNSWSLGIFDI